jgi:hypothetical protein
MSVASRWRTRRPLVLRPRNESVHGWRVLDSMQMALVHLPHYVGSLLSVVSRVTLLRFAVACTR